MNVFELEGTRRAKLCPAKAEADRYQPGDPGVSNFIVFTRLLRNVEENNSGKARKYSWVLDFKGTRS